MHAHIESDTALRAMVRNAGSEGLTHRAYADILRTISATAPASTRRLWLNAAARSRAGKTS